MIRRDSKKHSQETKSSSIETSTNIQGDCVKEQVQIVLEEENRSQKDTSKHRSKNEKIKSLSSGNAKYRLDVIFQIIAI